MKKIAEIVAIIFFILLILSLPTSAQVLNEYADCNKPLIAGRENLNSGISAGTVTVTLSVDDPDILIVEFETDDGWVMKETHLYVGSTAPTTSAPGRFMYKHDPVKNPYQDTYVVSLESHEMSVDNQIYFAAHAALQLLSPDGDVLQEETAWARGIPIRNAENKPKNWAMYFICTSGGEEDDGNEEQY